MNYSAYPEFWDDDWVIGHADRARLEGVARFASWLASEMTDLRFGQPALESPLEAVFYAWWHALGRADWSTLIELSPQRKVTVGGTHYRLDFAVSCSNYMVAEQARALHIPYPKVAIELDGRDFHERTKEQVAERDSRDRALQQDGWIVLHFSGPEMNKDPDGCVRQAAVAALKPFNEFYRQVRMAALERLSSEVPNA